jgi:molybdate transport system permease protein
MARRPGVQIGFTTVAVVLARFVSTPFYSRRARWSERRSELERVAYTLGHSVMRTFLRVTVPLAFPALLSGAVMAWARPGEFGATIMFAGNLHGRTQTMPLAIYLGGSDLTAALVLSAILILVPFGGLFCMRLLLRRGIFGAYA